MTLLEVIVAMAVLSFGIVAALGAISAFVRNSQAAESYSHGALLAQQVAAELDRQETLEPGGMSGTFDDMATGYSWQAEVAEPLRDGYYPVHITVLWDGERHKYEMDAVLHPHPVPVAAPAPPAGEPGGSGGSSGAPGGTGGTGGVTITRPAGNALPGSSALPARQEAP